MLQVNAMEVPSLRQSFSGLALLLTRLTSQTSSGETSELVSR